MLTIMVTATMLPGMIMSQARPAALLRAGANLVRCSSNVFYSPASNPQQESPPGSEERGSRSGLLTTRMMALSEEEKAKAYQEQVKRAEAMAKDPSLREASKPLFEVPGFKAPWDKKDDDDDDDGMDLKAKFEQAAKGWSAAVNKQQAVNRGEAAEAAAEEVVAPAEEATEDAEAAARIAVLEAQMEALRKQMEE